jgi:hypothetical protein
MVKFFSTVSSWLFFGLQCSFHLGVELLNQSGEAGEALLKMLWHHPDAILCCSFKVFAVATRICFFW